MTASTVGPVPLRTGLYSFMGSSVDWVLFDRAVNAVNTKTTYLIPDSQDRKTIGLELVQAGYNASQVAEALGLNRGRLLEAS